MNEEIEYAEMLEIPVSTVNVIRKNKKSRKMRSGDENLKEETISRINENTPYAACEDATGLENGEYFDGVDAQSNEMEDAYPLDFGEYPDFIKPISRAEQIKEIVVKAEFGVACALCLGIFLTNVWMPKSAINTFFRSLVAEEQAIVDERDYTDFTLSGILGGNSDAEMTLSPTGILSFTQEGCVYPTADGTVAEVLQDANGKYTVKIAHTGSFSGVIDGLDYVYYTVGQTVKHNVPVGYSEGENEVQVTMYSDGNLLNCFSVTEENTLVWITESK